MIVRQFGSSGVKIPIIGQGTWNLEGADKSTAIKSIQKGIDLGLTHVDTAEMYGHGCVEELLGHAIRDGRHNVFLVSKVLPSNASRRGTIKACERSLRRLGTGYLDCYLLHWKGSYPLADTVEAFEELVKAGKIRTWGVSNFDEDELAEIIHIAGEGRVACNQVLYHLGERSIEHAVIPFCEMHHIAVVGYSPFGSGQFPSTKSQRGRILAEVGKSQGKSPYQVALAFLTREASVFSIPKAATLVHVLDNAAASNVVLTDEDLKRIEEAFPRGIRRPGIPTL